MEQDLSALRPLIIDDDALARAVLSDTLTGLGVKSVYTASGSERAFEIIEANKIDVVFCDLHMPVTDGVEMLRHLERYRFRGSVAIISAAEERVLETTRMIAERHGLHVLGVARKPFDPTHIAALLQKHGPKRTGVRVPPTVGELTAAIARQQIEPWFQPKVSLLTGEVKGLEMLGRWRHPERGIIPPIDFIPLAEDNNLIADMTWQLLRRSLEHLSDWRKSGFSPSIAINMSATMLAGPRTRDMMVASMGALGVEESAVTIEVTETRLVDDHSNDALDTLVRLSLAGFRLSLDDFGTGTSNFSLLRRVPWHELKIDKTFVQGAVSNGTDRAVLSSSLELTRQLKITSVAEGIETEEQAQLCRSLGAEVAQGYLFAKPMPAEEILPWLAKR